MGNLCSMPDESLPKEFIPLKIRKQNSASKEVIKYAKNAKILII